MEILRGRKDQCLSLWNALDFVCPLPRNLDRRLNSLRTSVHWQDHVISEDRLDLLCPFREHIVVECSRGEGESLSLFAQSLDEFRVAMTLVDGAVGGEEVEVVFAFGVPD